MDLKNINPTAQATFRVIGEGGKEETVSFTVTLLGKHMLPDYVRWAGAGKLRLSKVIEDALVDVVVGWDLTLDGKPLECSEENKRKFFPAILGLELAGSEGERLDNYLGWALVNFAGEQGHFLKN